MSDVRQRAVTADCAAPAITGAAWGRAARAALAGVAGLLAGAGSFITNLLLSVAAAALALSWRLGQGPLDLSPLAHLVPLPAGLHVAAVGLQWASPDRQALLVTVHDASGPGGSVSRAAMTFDAQAAVDGRAEPLDIMVDGLRLALVRGADGVIAPAGSVPGGSVPGSGAAPGFPPPGLDSVRHLRLTDAIVTLADAGLGTVTVSGDLDGSRDGAGMTGAARLHVTEGDTAADVTAKATVTSETTAIDIVATPTELATVLAGAPHVAGTAGRLGLHAALTLDPALHPRALTVQATMGPGRIVVDGVPVGFRAIDLDGSAGWDPGDLRPTRAEIRRAVVTVAAASGAATTAVVQARLERAAEQVTAEGTLELDHMALADLSQFWPKPWGGHARPWIVENIIGGTARDGRAQFGGTVRTDGSAPILSALTVTLQGDDVTIAWLAPVPPVRHGQAILTMTGPDLIEVRISSARQGAIALQNGLVRITGLSVKDQDLSVVADIVNGAVPEILELLKHPKLNLLSAHPIKIERPAGIANGRLAVTLPLEEDLQFEQVGIHAAGSLTGLRLGGLVAGQDLDHGRIGFDVTQDGLRADGNASVAGMPSQVGVTMDFTAGPPGHVTQTAAVRGRATPQQLAAAGVDASPVLTGGTVGVAAELTERENQGATITVAADLAQAQVRLLGWRKEPGAPARATATFTAKDDRLTGIPALHAEGAGLLVDGRAEIVGDQPSRLVLTRAQLGPTRAAGVIDLPAQPGGTLRAELHGTMLDVSNELGGAKGDTTGAPPKVQPIVADVHFDTIRLAAGSELHGVTAHAEYDGTTVRALQVQTTGPERLQALIAPGGTGRRMQVRIADGGAVLGGLGVTSSLVGGALAIDGQFDDRTPGSPLTATLDITEFHLRDAPWVGKLLQALSVYGLPEAMSGPGLKFSRLIAPFVWSGKSVFVGESRAFSASLGITAKGVADLGRDTLDLTGTIVPFYAVNAALGRLPTVGRLFSPEQGGGLFAVTFGVRGPASNPSIAVNPLSVLTPGLARRVFRLFN